MTHLDGVPNELKAYKQFVLVRVTPKGEKIEKKPINPRSRIGASHSNPDDWGWFHDVAPLVGGRYWLGFALWDTDPFTFVDLDHVVEVGKPSEWASGIITQLNTNTEVSVSGTGVHMLCRATKPGRRANCNGVEMYDRARVVTLTGNHLAGTPIDIEPRQEAIDDIYKRYLEPPPRPKPIPSFYQPPVYASEEHTLSKMLQNPTIMALWLGDASRYDGDKSRRDMALASYLKKYFGPIPSVIDRFMRMSECVRERDKWDEVHYGDRATYGQRIIERVCQ